MQSYDDEVPGGKVSDFLVDLCDLFMILACLALHDLNVSNQRTKDRMVMFLQFEEHFVKCFIHI